MSTIVIKPAVIRVGTPATFGVHSDVPAPYRYHWKKNGALIGGSHWVSMTTPPLQESDLTAKWSVIVFGQREIEESEPVQLETSPLEAVTISSAVPPKPPWQADIDAAIAKEKS